jgi:hypothetical protein
MTDTEKHVITAMIRALNFMVSLLKKVKKGEKV